MDSSAIHTLHFQQTTIVKRPAEFALNLFNSSAVFGWIVGICVCAVRTCEKLNENLKCIDAEIAMQWFWIYSNNSVKMANLFNCIQIDD